jgi:hypothetical protein
VEVPEGKKVKVPSDQGDETYDQCPATGLEHTTGPWAIRC